MVGLDRDAVGREDAGHERRLGCVVRRGGVVGRVLALPRGVLPGECRVGAQRVSERQPLDPQRAAGFGQVQVVGVQAGTGIGSEEQPGLGTVRPVDVPQPGERGVRAANVVEVNDTGEHVDHRLGRHPGDRGRPDVLDAAGQPGGQHTAKHGPLGLERGHPAWVVRHHGWVHPTTLRLSYAGVT